MEHKPVLLSISAATPQKTSEPPSNRAKIMLDTWQERMQ